MIRLLTLFICLFTITTFGQVDSSIVPLASVESSIVQDVKYATTDNFTKTILYPTGKVYLRKIVAEKLSMANDYFIREYGYRIKIFDGYRPRSVQYKMWEVYPNSNYVADLKKGSKHNRGAAVDITLIDKSGNELNMGTPYDTFDKKAHYAAANISKEARRYRDILREVMMKFGFKGISTEWWHFDYREWKQYSLLDIPIK